ncbi:MAG: TIGR02391 family protein [Chloroflexi bacterium]|nr:TIGR02391 family protein [Chloroflexota bacterium]
MPIKLEQFEKIVRRSVVIREKKEEEIPEQHLHPFDIRNIHPKLPEDVKKLFDNGHFAQATFEAFKFIDKEIQRHSGIRETGYKLMMQAFAEKSPAIKLTKMANESEIDEQKGFQFLFAGSVLAIRNPRGHEYGVKDDVDSCLDHLSLASILMRKLEQENYI